jgi:hypothetical protein
MGLIMQRGIVETRSQDFGCVKPMTMSLSSKYLCTKNSFHRHFPDRGCFVQQAPNKVQLETYSRTIPFVNPIVNMTRSPTTENDSSAIKKRYPKLPFNVFTKIDPFSLLLHELGSAELGSGGIKEILMNAAAENSELKFRYIGAKIL